MDMDMTISKEGLHNSRDLSIYFLDTIKITLAHLTRERAKLFYSDEAFIGDDEEIKFIIDPRDKNIGGKVYPVQDHGSPK